MTAMVLTYYIHTNRSQTDKEENNQCSIVYTKHKNHRRTMKRIFIFPIIVWYDIHQSSQLYQNCIMLAQFAVRRLSDRMHRVYV